MPSPAVTFDGTVITLDLRLSSGVLPDPEDNFTNEGRLLDHLARIEFVQVERQGRLVRIRPGTRLQAARRSKA